MRTIPVIESEELMSDVIEVPETEAYEVIQTFSLDCCHPRLGKCVCVGCLHRRSDHLSALIGKELIKSMCKLSVAITDQILDINALLLAPSSEAVCLL